MIAVRIRPAEAQDDSAIGELWVESFVSTYARKMPEVVVTESRKADLRNVAEKRARACVLVAERDGEIAGAVALFRPGSPASKSWLANAADLRYLAVSPKFHGQGIAPLLLDETERLAREWAVDAITLHVRRGAHGVAKLYTARGYVRAPDGDRDQLPEIYLEGHILEMHDKK